MPPMASYSVNDAGVARARELIDARQYVLDSDWGDSQPNAEAQNTYLQNHSWEDYAALQSRTSRLPISQR